MSSSFLTVSQVAQQLSVKPDTVNSWIRRGELRGQRVGPRMWRIHPDDLRLFLARWAPVSPISERLEEERRKLAPEIMNCCLKDKIWDDTELLRAGALARQAHKTLAALVDQFLASRPERLTNLWMVPADHRFTTHTAAAVAAHLDLPLMFLTDLRGLVPTLQEAELQNMDVVFVDNMVRDGLNSKSTKEVLERLKSSLHIRPVCIATIVYGEPASKPVAIRELAVPVISVVSRDDVGYDFSFVYEDKVRSITEAS